MSSFYEFFKHIAYLVIGMYRDERGTTLTEFLLTVPIFITVFAGILALGSLSMDSVKVEALAHKKTFTNARAVQLDSNPAGIHATPGSAGGSAAAQIGSFKPRRTQMIGQIIRLIELDTYGPTGLAITGHWGESYGRLKPLQGVGLKADGMYNASREAPTGYYLDVTGKSVLARELISDAFTETTFDGATAGSSAGSALDFVVKELSNLVTAVGVRPAIATGMRYGTVTGNDLIHSTIHNVDRTLDAHYTISVAPYVAPKAWTNAARSTAISRLTMVNHPHYQDIIGFDDEKKFNIVDYTKIPTPELQQVGFGGFLLYDATLY